MQVRADQASRILANTPTVLHAMFSGLDELWVYNNYGPETFSPFDVVGHLLHGEQEDWIPRIKIILEYGENRPFDPFDRYAMYESSRGKTIWQLLEEFQIARRDNLDALQSLNLTAQHLEMPGTHPALGRVTLGQLIATWACHDLNHIHQIAKCMAWQYQDQLGPWREYLTFVDR